MFFSIPFLGFQFQTPNRSGRAPFDHFDSSRWLHVSNKWGSSGHLLLANTLDNFSSFMLSMFRWIHIHMNCPTLPDKFFKFVWMDIYWKELSLGIVIIALIHDKILVEEETLLLQQNCFYICFSLCSAMLRPSVALLRMITKVKGIFSSVMLGILHG